MSLTVDGVLPLPFRVIQNARNQFSDEGTAVQTNRGRARRKTRENFQDVPTELPKEIELTPFEAARELHEKDRRQSVVQTMQFLQSRKILKGLIRNLERIIDGRSERVAGFKSKIEVSKEDLFIKDVASNLCVILKNYPVYQNVQVVMGFIEMVNLIDKLERIGIEGETHEFGFHSISTKPKAEKQIDSLAATEYAKELRAKLPGLLEWLEIPAAIA